MNVAVKLVKNGAPQEERVKLLQEAAIMGQFRHKHIACLVGMVTVGELVSYNCFFFLLILHYSRSDYNKAHMRTACDK